MVAVVVLLQLLVQSVSIRIQDVCADPTPVAKLSLDTLRPLQDVRSGYALMQILRADGWVWELLPAKTNPALHFYSVGGRKVWLSRTSRTCKAYLACLVDAPRLLNSFGIQRIVAGQKPHVYKKMFLGEIARPCLRAIEDDHATFTDHDAPMIEDEAGIRGHSDGESDDGGWLEDDLARLIFGDLPAAPPDEIPRAASPEGDPAPSTPLAPRAIVPFEPASPRRRIPRAVRPFTFPTFEDDPSFSYSTKWWGGGLFRITPLPTKPTEPFGRWEADCPFHRKNTKSGCRRSLKVQKPGAAGQWAILNMLRHWCNRAELFDRQWKHLMLDLSEVPDPAVVLAQMIDPIRRPIGRVLNDIELDAGEVAPVPLADADAAVADMDGPGPDEAGPDSSSSGPEPDEAGPDNSSSPPGTSSGSSSSLSS